MTARALSKVRVFAPATVANVGSAFDVPGFALEAPGDTVEATRLPHLAAGRPLSLVVTPSGTETPLPDDPDRNTAGVAVSAMLSHLSASNHERVPSHAIALSLTKGLPIGSGLGSSSASAVAALVAVNMLLDEPYTRQELLPFAMEAERVACGSAHADNVAPALLGGFVAVRSYAPLDVISLPTPPSLWIAVVTPDIEVKTQDARKILKNSVLLADAITQWGNVAGLVAGIFTNDIPLIGRSLQDRVIEPSRSSLLPYFSAVRAAALSAGAAGFAISGSGPSLFTVCASQEIAQRVAKVMRDEYLRVGVENSTHVSRINSSGAVVLSKE